MADGIYVSMAGATARERELESIADDLANAQTPGFKSSRPAFATVLAEAGGLRAFPAAVGAGVDRSAGPTAATQNPLDVLPEDNAYLAVRSGDGSVAFTRNGRLTVDAGGTLRAVGLPVLDARGNALAIPPGTSVEIGSQGQVLADGNELGRLALFRLDGTAQKSGPSLLQPSAGGAAVQVDGKVETGAIELGNRPALDSMVGMISAQRSFDASMQALDAYRKMGDRSNELGKIH